MEHCLPDEEKGKICIGESSIDVVCLALFNFKNETKSFIAVEESAVSTEVTYRNDGNE